MSKQIHIESEVNALFKEGLKHLLLGFDPFEFEDIVKNIKGIHPWTMFIDNVFIEEVLEPYSKNWTRVIKEFFIWNKKDFLDPVDQCFYIAQSTDEIFDMLFENVVEDRKNPFFRRLEMQTALHLNHLKNEIETWAMTHKFYTQDIEVMDVLEDDGI